ncbi:MAG TPA: hypothetical protein VFA32_22720 [Dehalococcoidia bacterium]|jgi:hypothetical protein|nr:hypothetical protein [Dehalococcoidia bacterium]
MTDGDQEFLSAIKSVLKTLVKDAIRPGVSSAAETTWNKLRGMIDPAAHSVAGNILDETKLEEIHSAAMQSAAYVVIHALIDETANQASKEASALLEEIRVTLIGMLGEVLPEATKEVVSEELHKLLAAMQDQ